MVIRTNFGGFRIPTNLPLTLYPIPLTFMAGDSLVAREFTVADEVVPRLVAASVMLTHVRTASRAGVSTNGRRLERSSFPVSQCQDPVAHFPPN